MARSTFVLRPQNVRQHQATQGKSTDAQPTAARHPAARRRGRSGDCEHRQHLGGEGWLETLPTGNNLPGLAEDRKHLIRRPEPLSQVTEGKPGKESCPSIIRPPRTLGRRRDVTSSAVPLLAVPPAA